MRKGRGLSVFVRALLAMSLATVVGLLGVPSAAAQEPATTILVYHGAPNETINAGVAAIEALGAANDFEVETTQSAADFTAANLDGYRAVVFLGNAGDQLNAAQESALQAFVQDGNGFVGIGGAAEAEAGSTFFGNLIGARPVATSQPGSAEMVVAVGDRVHPATRDLPLEWTRTDVWYQWQTRPTHQVHTVARYRAPGAPAGDGTNIGGTDWPISWCRDFQGGRSFYTGMGRTAASFGEAQFRTHLLGAIQWSAGMVRAGCKATIAANYEGERLIDGTSGTLAHTGESHGVATAPNGWVFTIGRADCRTDAQRGEMIGQGPTPRILDFANRNVGVGCGPIHIWDPAAHEEGSVNSGVTLAGVLPVYGDRGGGDEINGKIEAGLLGITVSPDFAQTGHIYLQYFPTFNPDNPVHPGLADGDQRRITKMAKPRISRFTVDLETKQVDFDSEVVIFEYESQIYSCCHRGGGMGFDSEGNLYVTTGDSNSSQRTNGTSGNYQPARCPTGPPTEASNNHCGNNAISFSDARRTAGSTNDYNGKMLRFNPVDTIADGAQPTVGINSTYTLPTAQSPNGPNLFSGTEGNGSQAKPEIYAMGLRNPSRLFIDPETDIPYSAWVGPDAGSPSATLGPSTYENATQLAQAGNYGWPYCMGNQQAYRDRVADGSLRTTNTAGYVSGGPAASPTQGWYDCKNLVNDSTNNTGLTVLPHQTGTGMDAGTARPVNLWYSRGNPGGANGCPDFPRELGPDNAPNYGAPTPAALCPYLTASGATVFNGPVYRYDDTATDNADRWPEYWDGRWFLQDFGNQSAKHGLLLDPATDQDGGKPVYADSLRGVLNWQANYMDSKFGPDGALYVQVYSGFFTTGPQAGLYRFAYTGGPDTPNPDPEWATTGTPREIQFSLGSSGGVAYEWDFGDGSATSTTPEPAHTYAAAGTYDVTLTVTYADGEELSQTIEVNVSADAAAPTTTAELTGDGPVEVTLSATDGTGGTGVEWTEYRIDGGAWTRNENTTGADPFVTTFEVEDEGDHTVEFRSRDGSGNEEQIKQVQFTIEPEGGGGGGTCLAQSDEFDGTALGDAWDVLRPAAGNGPTVSGGSLNLPILQGDFIANDTLASNTVLQDAPDGEWTATARLDTTQIDANGEQAGFVIWKSENPNTFSKIVAIQSGAGNHQFEHIVTQSGGVDPPISQSITPAPGGQLPDQVLLRARYDGENVIGEFSADEGETWTLIGQEGHAAPLEAPLRIGLVAFRGGTGGGTASFDWVRVHAGSEPGGPSECGGACNPLSDQFDGTELDPKWELVNPNATNPPGVENGHLTLPLVPGDLYGDNGSAQALLQQAPAGSWVATAKIAHANIDTNGEAAGLALVNRYDPNYFVKTAVQYKSDTGAGQPGKWAERVLTSNDDDIIIPPETVPWPNSGALNLTGDYVWVRFVHDAEAQEITTWTSTNGTTFTQFGAAIPVDEYLNQPGGLRVGLFGKHDGSGDDEVAVDAFNVVAGTTDPQTPGDDCGGADECPQNDEFEGTSLDDKWEVVNPVPAGLEVGGGNLTLTTAQGDVFGGNFTAQNILLQDVPDGPWTATAKLDHTSITVNGQAAGLVIYGQENPNHFAKATLQFKNDVDPNTPGNQPGKWIERTLTTNGNLDGSYGGNFPNTGALNPPTSDLWIRATYDGTNVITSYSYDGVTFTNWAQPVPATAYGANGVTKIGVFVKHDGAGPAADVAFDSFMVEAESCAGGGDTTPPRTTHALDPAGPDGEGGWYTSPVEVTLTATDNEGGEGVESTEYRFAGDEEWIAYDGPITVDDEGRHTIEYRSTDAAGNVESTRSVSFMIDPNAPTTTATLNGEPPAASYDGPVEVDLDADDGDGSGVRATEIRVDGGEWQPYVEEETILNSAADLERWEQAGPGGLNWMTEEGGFARTFGGLGMPWYPKEYGDFSLKLQWRDSSTGTNGNSGIFARFPHPEEAVSRPAAERYPCQVGSATSSPAWVAIYCGHEIQINDHQGDAQKTGSIYNFSPNNAEQAQIQPRGTWVDYELRVVGQQYTVIRNGVVIKEFLNAPDQQSSRPGDPPTNARQFARGYIGLQNHGNPDVIDFRNVRVLSLDEGSVQGPITVEGDGEHTVEFRSTDVAGNVEDVKSVTFTIGAADGTPPVTTHELEQGASTEPVTVTLSATDPDEAGGGGTPETHDVFALPSSWDPSTFEAATGDVVRWNFPEATAGAPHNVYVIEPGEAPDSAGTRVGDEVILPGSPPVSTTLDEAGTWTYVCKIHSHVEGGQWVGMVGTAEVSEAGGTPGSGVDFTEYRLNGGEWVRSENTAGDDPFETVFTVSEPGEHLVEYRSTDNAGNQEAVKSAEFEIAEADPEAPTAQAFADPASGTAPLVVQFSATGLDPQGGELLYEWDFGDESGSFDQSPRHTYTEPGTYTATVTVTDPQGKTGTDTVEIVVEDGNQAPVVRATSVPGRGDAPLTVAFSARATDDGPAGELTYLWDFDDGGATAFGRDVEHTYRTPGTYAATVTVTDRGGKVGTAEVTVVVGDPSGPPTVEAAATPVSGTAPLEVRFTSVARDPQGHAVSTVWNFGDGQQAGGPAISHVYRTPGTYTATVTVTDPDGLTATDSVQITVNPPGSTQQPQGLQPQGSPPTQTPTGGGLAETGTRPRIRAPKSMKVQSAIRRGLRLKVSCAEACRVRSVLRLSGRRVGASKRLSIKAGGTRTVLIRLDGNVRRNLMAAMRQARLRRVTTTAVTTVRTAELSRAYPAKIRLRR